MIKKKKNVQILGFHVRRLPRRRVARKQRSSVTKKQCSVYEDEGGMR